MEPCGQSSSLYPRSSLIASASREHRTRQVSLKRIWTGRVNKLGGSSSSIYPLKLL